MLLLCVGKAPGIVVVAAGVIESELRPPRPRPTLAKGRERRRLLCLETINFGKASPAPRLISLLASVNFQKHLVLRALPAAMTVPSATFLKRILKCYRGIHFV